MVLYQTHSSADDASSCHQSMRTRFNNTATQSRSLQNLEFPAFSMLSCLQLIFFLPLISTKDVVFPVNLYLLTTISHNSQTIKVVKIPSCRHRQGLTQT